MKKIILLLFFLSICIYSISCKKNKESTLVTTHMANATCGNNALIKSSVISFGETVVSQRGVVWGFLPKPTLADNLGSTKNEFGGGIFESNITGLIPNTDYYVRAYAIREGETFYGNSIKFNSLKIPCACNPGKLFNESLSYGSVTDIDNNIYKTIVIGNQEWMAENLRVGHYRNGERIPNISDPTEWARNDTGAFGWNQNDSLRNNCPYGKLYSWFAATNPKNICPEGWHLPSKQEFEELINYLGGDSVAGEKLRASNFYYWNSSNLSGSNASGFSAVGSGCIGTGYSGNLGYRSMKEFCYLCTSENPVPTPQGPATFLILANYSSWASFTTNHKALGTCIRCLKD
jgi:uncharacterized protein (TIGR02145 family)